jgi:hypothetical protein
LSDSGNILSRLGPEENQPQASFSSSLSSKGQQPWVALTDPTYRQK